MTAVVGFESYRAEAPSAVTIGVFDGVHRGHQALIQRTIEIARENHRRSIVITFDPAPVAVLAPNANLAYLLSLPERLERIARLGPDAIAVLAFDRAVSETTAATFMDDLAARIRTKDLVIGPDFALGRRREGTAPVLANLGEARGITVHQLPPLVVAGQRVSSTRIRDLIRSGDVKEAIKLLGHAPTVRGRVVAGAGRGRTIGVPTANVDVPGDRCTPADGVYAAIGRLEDGRRVPAAVNIGVRPSFDEGQRAVEAHLIDFTGDLYGQELTIEFIERLRPEMRFQSLADLVDQIRADIDRTRRIVTSDSDDRGPSADAEEAR